jgi:pyruvate,water dikinase
MEKGMMRFFGGPPPAQDTPGLIRGNPGSAGTVRGPVKIVRILSEAGKLVPGDILVAVTTAPPWTPLFATVGAVVTDTGGVLSHCAVVAREYGIPAVVGTGSATNLLHDGQLVEVDGAQGIVRLLDAAA